MSGLLCAGDVYFNRLDASGNPLGLVALGNTSKFAIKESADQKIRTSRGRSTYGQALDVVFVKKPSEISIAGDEFDANGLAIALLGDVSTLTQSSGTATAEAVTAKLGYWVPLAHGRVSSVVVKDATDATTYVAGTDYLVNAELGMIQALTGGTITDGATIHVSYSYAAITGSAISGSTQPTVKGALVLDGVNLATQKPVIVRVDQASLAPNKEVDFKSGDFAGLELVGILATLPNKTSPYTVELRG